MMVLAHHHDNRSARLMVVHSALPDGDEGEGERDTANRGTVPPPKEVIVELKNKQKSIPWASWAMIVLPFGSVIFPLLLSWARSLPSNSSEQLQVVTALFATDRIYLYTNAAVIVALAAIRGSNNDSPKLGQRLTDLTEEILFRPNFTLATTSLDDPESSIAALPPSTRTRPELIQSLTESGLEGTLDEVSADRQALFLPVLVSALLAISVLSIPFWNGLPVEREALLGDDTKNWIRLLQSILPYVSQLWNAGLLTLFTRAELRRLKNEVGPAEVANPLALLLGPYLEWVLAAGITCVAYFTPLWPVQNFVNMALAIAVARAIQLDRFAAIVCALALLTLYDASAVFMIPSAGATDPTTIMLPSETIMRSPTTIATTLTESSIDLSHGNILLADKSVADSAMGAVAIQKLTSGTFQPGLLQTRIDGRFLGGSLGLGDAVFPSLLATFVRRFDIDSRVCDMPRQHYPSLFAVSLAGYLLGCASCEIVPAALSNTGLPALVFIIPAMLLSVVLVSASVGNLRKLWTYDPMDKSIK